MEPIISVKGLISRFGEQTVHDGLDMDVYPGEIFGIVGGSGSGKSVLLRTILGLKEPEGGKVIIEGYNMANLKEKQGRRLYRHMGIMYQSGALFSGLTLAENIEFPMLEYMKLPEEVIHHLAMIKLGLVGLKDAAGKFPAELSGGMVKRAGLARALALDPPILFLDEPTAGLDPIAANGFDALILNLRDKLGLTVVMITHDLDTLADSCDKIGALVDGKMVQGTIEDIMKNPNPWIQEYFGGPRAKKAFVPASGKSLPPFFKGGG